MTPVERFEIRNRAGEVLATFTAPADVSVRIEVPLRLAYLTGREARDLAEWLHAAADAIAAADDLKRPPRRKETNNNMADDNTAAAG